MNKKSVILINYLGKKGGGSAYAYEMTKALKEAGFTLIAILSELIENKELWDNLGLEKIIYIKTYTTYFDFIKSVFSFGKTRRFIKSETKEYDVTNIYIPMEQPLTKKVNKIFPKAKTILTVHDVEQHSGINYITYFINELFFNFRLRNTVNHVILLSNVFVSLYNKKYKFPIDKISVIRHGLFYNYGTELKAPTEKIEIVFFGRITKYKGLDILIQAFIKLQNEHDVKLLVVGSGDMAPYNEQLKQVKNKEVHNRWIKDEEISNFFSKKSILVAPYKDATQSGVISVANLLKVPVIASNAGGLVEQVEDGVTGLLFETGDANNLYVKMKHMINNPTMIEEIVENAYKQTKDLWKDGAKLIGTIIQGE